MPCAALELPIRENPRYPTAICGLLADPGGFNLAALAAVTFLPHQIHAKISDYERVLRRKNSWGDMVP